ncbi:TonB-dependent receptor [Caulobacter hibisci]|uniref:TonB-dependent receptor n=1 Tax=Caulobacter hibisci TaxID=2035993 RepID=A0ABS0T437_9CAUL|nr:TonB-dependent receptor [Caulobacter hibisci]
MTARNKSESLQDVPITINAVSAETIERRNISDISRVAQSTSGLTFDQGLTPSDTRPAIRGVQAVRGRPNVAILVDGVDTSSEAFATAGGGALASLRFVDAERIEVVKGPQSVLYGRSAFSGAINYISKRPNLDEFEAKISLEAGDFGLKEGKVSLTGPLVKDKLALSLNAGAWETDGQYLNSVSGARVGGGEAKGAALGLLIKPTENLTVFARVQHSHEEYDQMARAFITSVNPATGTANTADLGVSALDGTKAGYTVKGNLANAAVVRNQKVAYSLDPRTGKDFTGTVTDATRASFEINYESDWGTFTSLTGITRGETTQVQDFDSSDYSLTSNILSSYASVAPFYGSLYQYLGFLRAYGLNYSTVAPTGGLPAIGFSVMLDDDFDTKQQSQTLRWSKDFGKLRTSLEGLYFHEQASQINKDQFWMRAGSDPRLTILTALFMGGGATATGTFQAPTTTAKATADYPLKISRETDSLSWAGSVEYDVTDALTVRFDGRYIEERIAYHGSPYQPMYYRLFGVQLVCLAQLGCAAGPAGTAAARAAQLAKTTQIDKKTVQDHAFTPNFVANYKLSSRNSVYASYGEGFKPGGVDTTGTSGSVDSTFKPEKLQSFEIGSKNVLLDGDLVLNGAIFFNRYKNQQIGTTKVLGGTSVPSVENAGESESKGFDLSSDWRATNWLTLSGNYTYTDAEFTDYKVPTPGYFDRIESTAGNYTGKAVPLTPKHSLNLSALLTGDLPVGAGWTWTTELSGRYQSKRYMTQNNLTWLPSYFVSDLRAGVTDGSWSLDLAVTNLLDDDTPKNAIAATDFGFFDLVNNMPVRAYVVSLPEKRAASIRISKTF